MPYLVGQAETMGRAERVSSLASPKAFSYSSDGALQLPGTVAPEAVDWWRLAYEQFLKRAIDLIVATVLLLAVAPMLLVTLLLVRATQGSGVIFRQRRVGRNNRAFTVYKIRTMLPDRRVASVPFVATERRQTHKHPNDPRLTPVGRCIRKWSIDELPQLWNVVRGDMSLVGPRPEMVQIVEERYEPWQLERHRVRPGMTGLWQVSARGDEAPMHMRTDLDIEYVHRLSFLFDCKILLRTVPAVFQSASRKLVV